MIVIYTTAVTNRLIYTLDTVFREYYDLPYILITNTDDAPDYGFRLNYSGSPLSGWYSVYRCPLLFESGIKPQVLNISRLEDMPVFFRGDDSCDLSFDIFASVFYLLSRYEEYLPHEQDIHGRYLASNSILSHPEFTFCPIVETWLIYFRSKLQQYESTLPFKINIKETELTFDIDQAFAYKGRRWPKILRSLLKPEGREVLFHNNPDPFDTLPRIFSFLKEHSIRARFFFLLNDRGKYNSSVNPYSGLLKEYIQQCYTDFDIGLHPSYHYRNNINTEKYILNGYTGISPFHCRQHFLRIRFPEYFHHIMASGFTHDHSLGYPDTPGFRAGFSRPFLFFDLIEDMRFDLWINPFSFMDATFIYYDKSDTDQIIKKFLALSDQISKVNGKLVTVCHNDLLADSCPVDFWEILKNCAVIK